MVRFSGMLGSGIGKVLSGLGVGWGVCSEWEETEWSAVRPYMSHEARQGTLDTNEHLH